MLTKEDYIQATLAEIKVYADVANREIPEYHLFRRNLIKIMESIEILERHCAKSDTE